MWSVHLSPHFSKPTLNIRIWSCADGCFALHLGILSLTPERKKPPPMQGQTEPNQPNEVLSLARHATGLALVRIDRNQEGVAVGVGEFVSLYIGAVIEGTIHFKTVIVLSPKIFYVLQYHAVAIGARLTLQLHGGHFTTTKPSVDDIPSPTDLDRSFLHFQFAPFQTVRLENHGRESVPLLFARGWIERYHDPFSFFVCAPLVAKIPSQPVLGPRQVRVSRVPFAHFDRHVELAVRVLGMFVEIAGTKQMTTASFHVISFHLPCRFSGSRGQQDQHTQDEKAYLHPASHIHLLFFLEISFQRGLTCFGEREDFTALEQVSLVQLSPEDGAHGRHGGASSGSRTSGVCRRTIPTVARDRNRAGGPHARL